MVQSFGSGLLDILDTNQVSGAPGLYPPNLAMNAVGERKYYAVDNDKTRLYAFPVARQEPIQLLSVGTPVEIAQEREDWLGVRLKGGFSAWVAREELVINGTSAVVRGLEASLYVEPMIDREVFKLGVVNSGEVLEVSDMLVAWVKVNTPDHFVAWIRKSSVTEVDAPAIEQDGVVENQQQAGAIATGETVKAPIQKSGSAKKLKLDSWYPVYSGGSITSRILGIVSQGTTVMVDEERNGFSRIEWQGGIEAWISGRFLEVDGSSGRVSGNNIRVRIMPDTSQSATIVGTLVRNDVVAVTGFQNDWYRIVIDDQGAGWVQNL